MCADLSLDGREVGDALPALQGSHGCNFSLVGLISKAYKAGCLQRCYRAILAGYPVWTNWLHTKGRRCTPDRARSTPPTVQCKSHESRVSIQCIAQATTQLCWNLARH